MATSSGPWIVYADPFGDGRENPAGSVAGVAVARAMPGERMEVTFEVSGLAAERTFGAHVHKLGCDDMKAGGHYQHQQSPTTATDPAYANAINEVWLDITTDAAGRARSVAIVDWRPRAGEARAIVVHAQKTAEGGVAGAKLACLPLLF